MDGEKLLFDPFLSRNDKAFKPLLDELSASGHVLVTHGHYDHAADIPAILRHGGGKTTVYCTASPRNALISKGVEAARIRRVAPGDTLNIGPFEINVLKGKHIVFDKALLIKTLVNPGILSNWSNFRQMFKENKIFTEAGETVVYHIAASGRSVLLMGSLNLDDDTEYPKNADLLIMPFQGRSDIGGYAVQFIRRLQPKKILLDHYDNTFPPVSSYVNPEPFIKLMRQKYPDIPVICPRVGADWVGTI